MRRMTRKTLCLTSVRFPRQWVRLDRIPAFEADLDAEYISPINLIRDYGEPLVVTGNPVGNSPVALNDGRHRVTAAKRNRVPQLWAVFAVTRKD